MNNFRWASKACFNPFKKNPSCASKANDLRPFPKKDIWKFSEADENCKLCSGCRKRVALYEPPVNSSDIDVLSQVSLKSSPSSNFSDSLQNFNDQSLETFLN
ncbi:hypothetical protein ABEB36_011539 [Hypothenemus hampei]|uniref:Uncharacterized protein n=1 Tax=Hypothenemus hampei TaxID=57062 RepID=A0ABD1E863_HYPHA